MDSMKGGQKGDDDLRRPIETRPSPHVSGCFIKALILVLHQRGELRIELGRG